MNDKLKLIGAVLAVAAGVVAFYYFGDKPGYIQLAVLVVPSIVAVALFYQTPAGKTTWEFAKGARQELRKVVWPNRKETMQVTIIVFVMAVVMAVFMWVVDWGLHKILIFTRS